MRKLLPILWAILAPRRKTKLQEVNGENEKRR